jgi:hypothetical protein
VVFIPGNHDEACATTAARSSVTSSVERELVHETADGRRFLLIHGDEFDQVTRHHRWVAVLGDKAYDLLVRLNGWLSWGRRKLGISGLLVAGRLRQAQGQDGAQFIFDFEDSAIHHARERGLDGVICGHIHWATIREVDGLTLRQLRRLGGFLHGHRRALRRPARTGRLGHAQPACRRQEPAGRTRRRGLNAHPDGVRRVFSRGSMACPPRSKPSAARWPSRASRCAWWRRAMATSPTSRASSGCRAAGAGRSGRPPGPWRAMHRAVLEAARDCDLIHIQTPFVAHYAGLKAARTLGLPVVATYHTLFEEYLQHYAPWLPAGWLKGLARASRGASAMRWTRSSCRPRRCASA